MLKIIPVNNVILVAIVDARKDLFHKNGSIFFSEFSSGNDFIEQLTSFTDPIELVIYQGTYSVTM
jgi:hypothetical protein